MSKKLTKKQFEKLMGALRAWRSIGMPREDLLDDVIESFGIGSSPLDYEQQQPERGRALYFLRDFLDAGHPGINDPEIIEVLFHCTNATHSTLK